MGYGTSCAVPNGTCSWRQYSGRCALIYTPQPLYNTSVWVQVSYPNRVILRVKCKGYIGKAVLNSYLGSNPDPCYIRNPVITNCVIMNHAIKRFRCIDHAHFSCINICQFQWRQVVTAVLKLFRESDNCWCIETNISNDFSCILGYVHWKILSKIPRN